MKQRRTTCPSCSHNPIVFAAIPRMATIGPTVVGGNGCASCVQGKLSGALSLSRLTPARAEVVLTSSLSEIGEYQFAIAKSCVQHKFMIRACPWPIDIKANKPRFHSKN